MLSGTDRISDIFPGNSLKEDHVSIVVRLKPIGETLFLAPTYFLRVSSQSYLTNENADYLKYPILRVSRKEAKLTLFPQTCLVLQRREVLHGVRFILSFCQVFVFIIIFLDLVKTFINPMKSWEDVQPMINDTLEHCKNPLMHFICHDLSMDTIKAFPQTSQHMLINGLGNLHITDEKTKIRIALTVIGALLIATYNDLHSGGILQLCLQFIRIWKNYTDD